MRAWVRAVVGCQTASSSSSHFPHGLVVPHALKDTAPIDQDADFYKKLLEALDEIKWNEDNLVSNGVRVSNARFFYFFFFL